jgi:hypothetical protein
MVCLGRSASHSQCLYNLKSAPITPDHVFLTTITTSCSRPSSYYHRLCNFGFHQSSDQLQPFHSSSLPSHPKWPSPSFPPLAATKTCTFNNTTYAKKCERCGADVPE